jgi:hypothetical protein
MQIIFEEPTKHESSGGDDMISVELPILDFRNNTYSQTELTDHIDTFSNGFWFRQEDPISDHEDIIQDIERLFLSVLENKPIDEVKYGRIGVKKDGSGGISDEGLLSYFFIDDLQESMGVILKEAYQWNPKAEELLKSLNVKTSVIDQIIEVSGKEVIIEGCDTEILLRKIMQSPNDELSVNIGCSGLTEFYKLYLIDSKANQLIDSRNEINNYGDLKQWYVEVINAANRSH